MSQCGQEVFISDLFTEQVKSAMIKDNVKAVKKRALKAQGPGVCRGSPVSGSVRTDRGGGAVT